MNPEHIRTIRAWLEIIAMKPRWTKKLISALIINLKIGGVFIRDTDLIQRDISRLLNADIGPAYNLVKQLARLFPVYFSEIGAEGELRDITTRIDELSARNDLLINFFRKQSHVESNSLLVEFAEDIFRYWFSGDKNSSCIHTGEVFDQVENAARYLTACTKFVSFSPAQAMIRGSFWSGTRRKYEEVSSVAGVTELGVNAPA